jgi:hypothetical protein
MPNPDGAADLKLFRAHLPAACGNPGSAALQSGNISNLLCFVANQQMSRWWANETEDAVKRVIVLSAALLASALSAHAAPVKKHLRVVNGRACHEIVLTKNDAVRYALGIASGESPLPQWDEIRRCAPRVSAEEFERERGR